VPCASFSSAAAAGATYGGLLLSLTALGTFEPSTQTGGWTSAAKLSDPSTGAVVTSWTGSGNISSPNQFFIDFNSVGARILDYETEEIVVFTPDGSVSFAIPMFTIAGEPIVQTGMPVENDAIEHIAGGIELWNTELVAPTNSSFPGFDLVADGSVDPSGNGTFITRLISTPNRALLLWS